MADPILITSLVFSLLSFFSFGAFVLISFLNLKREKTITKDVTLKNVYPCEISYEVCGKKKYLPAFIFLFAVSSFLLGVILALLQMIRVYDTISISAIFICLFGVFLIFLGTGTFITGLGRPKMHVIFTSIFFSVSILFCFAIGFYAISEYIDETLITNYSINLYIGIIFLALGLAGLGSLFNKKLKNWAKMDKTEVDGVTYYYRPKVNALALYEWIYLGSLGIVSLLISINTIIFILT